MRHSAAFFLVTPVTALGGRIVKSTVQLGTFVSFLWACAIQVLTPPFRVKLLVNQLEFVGNHSLNIILLTSLAIGGVFTLQVGSVFQIFQAESLVGVATAKALVRELSPLMTAFIVGGRAGSAMAAEIGTMKVNEQIDAMEAMAVDPVSYLVAPRLLATSIMMPLLCGLFSFVGILAGYLVATGLYGVDQGVFFAKITQMVYSNDVLSGLWKSIFFGVIIAVVACMFGLRASGGAKGVGNATTNAVVVIFLSVLGLDLVVTWIQIRWF